MSAHIAMAVGEQNSGVEVIHSSIKDTASLSSFAAKGAEDTRMLVEGLTEEVRMIMQYAKQFKIRN